MWNKLNRLAVGAYLGMTSFMRELKEDERGLSGIVVAVLLILVAVLAVVMVWGGLSGWLQQLWERITGTTDTGLTPQTLP